MSMTRKDFKSLARTLKSILRRLKEVETISLSKVTPEKAETIIMGEIIGFCQTQNALFDSNSFKSAVKD